MLHNLLSSSFFSNVSAVTSGADILTRISKMAQSLNVINMVNNKFLTNLVGNKMGVLLGIIFISSGSNDVISQHVLIKNKHL